MFKRVWSYLKGIGKAVFNRYESAVQRWGERSWLGQTYQSARFDADAATRQELQRRHRYWVCNSSLVNRIRCLFVQFSVGVEGLLVVPNSNDEDWNVARKQLWDKWCASPDLSSRLNFQQLCIQWAGALFDDGEVFLLKTEDKSGRPMLQTIEAHRIFTPPDKRGEEGKTICDGVKINTNGRPVGYYIQDEFVPNLPSADGLNTDVNRLSAPLKLVPAENIIHIYKARRPGMYRGIPEGFSGMNTLHDYEDLHMMEMQVAKMAAAIGNVETNPTGEIDTTATRRMRLTVQSQDQSSQAVTKNADQYYKVILGAQTIALKHGDSLKQFQVDRPSIVQQQYWDLLISEICCAYNVPKLLVVPYSLQGTVTRADLDICANAFRANFEIIAWAINQIYVWQTGWDVRFNREYLDGAMPENPLDCTIRPPRAPNVDIGYSAQALETEMKLGTKPVQDVYAERCQDWRHQWRQNAEAAYYKKQLAKEFSKNGIVVTPEEISQVIDAPPETGEKPQTEKAQQAQPAAL